MTDLEEALKMVIQGGSLVIGAQYSKTDLIKAFSEHRSLGPEIAESLFLQLRDGCQVGQFALETSGAKRGRKYALLRAAAVDASGRPELTPNPARRPASVEQAPSEAGAPGEAKLDIYFGDNLPLLRGLENESFDLIYIDPPFNTGKTQTLRRMKTIRDDANGDRVGFQGKRYRTVNVGSRSFADTHDDFLAFLEPRLEEARRLLAPNGSFFLHIDYREVHYCKVLLDAIFGRECFVNEIIWAYDYGARSKNRWSTKHDNILWYVKDPNSYAFNFDEMDRIPYMAPGLVGKEKAARGKTPTDVWWHTIVPTNGKERTGYPTQKPLGILNRIIKVHSLPGARVLDFFAGSGTTGEAAARLNRSAVLIDSSEEAMKVMRARLSFAAPKFYNLPHSPAIEEGASDSGTSGNDNGEEADPVQPSLF